MEKRVIELEKKTAFQEHTIEELSKALIAQQKRIDSLERELRRLREQQSGGAFIKKPEEEEPPPHY